MPRLGTTLVFLCALLGGFGSPADANAAEPHAHPPRPSLAMPSLAMHGEPAYPDGFSHFDYADSRAPQGGEIRFGVVGTFDSLNPFIVRGQAPQVPAFDLKGAVIEPLMARSWDEPFSLYGLIAQSVETPPDRSSVTFHLNPRARWQDGQPLTAQDVLFSWKTLRDHGRPNHRTYYKKVASAQILDRRTVRFVFARDAQGRIDREMPLIMALMPVLPAHIWQNRAFDRTTLAPPVGSGPYKVVSVDPGRSLVLEKDPSYWGRDLPSQRGLYNFARVRFDFYRDEGIALQAFKAGQFDVRRETDPKRWTRGYDSAALKQGKIKQETFEHHRPEATYGFVFNTRRPLLRDKTLRAAMDEALDFDWINRVLFAGLYKRTDSYFPNSELAATSGEKPPPRDPRQVKLRAASQLKQAGYTLRQDVLYAPNGQPVSFELMLNDPAEEKVALAWARSLRQLGIQLRVRTVDSAQFQARLASFDFDLTTARWYNSLSPGNEQIFFWGSQAARQEGSRNYPGIADPAIDALANAIPMAKTRPELIDAVRKLDRALLEGHYIVPLYYLGADLIAWRTEKLAHPSFTPLCGAVIEAWWRRQP